MGLTFGLGAAVCWGFADFFAALASRRVGALRVVLYFHMVAMVLLVALAMVVDGLAGVTTADVLPFVGIGALGWLSYLAFYGALAIGPISVVSPIVSGYAAVTVLLAVIIIGERLSTLATVAIMLTIGGVMLASTDVREILSASLRAQAVFGLVLAIVAMTLFGGFVFGVAYYQAELGWLAPIVLGRGFALLFLLGHATVTRQLRLPERPPALLGSIVFLALVDTGGYVLFNVGAGVADTAIVAAASAPYALVPIVMGVFLLAERPTQIQWAGVGLVIAGIVGLGIVS
jgi:drug/metabolite transporter (DMT)-like permease